MNGQITSVMTISYNLPTETKNKKIKKIKNKKTNLNFNKKIKTRTWKTQ